MVGFEPTTAGATVRSSTTELHPPSKSIIPELIGTSLLSWRGAETRASQIPRSANDARSHFHAHYFLTVFGRRLIGAMSVHIVSRPRTKLSFSIWAQCEPS